MSLLPDGVAYLDRAGVRFAVIGAAALAAHGISRSTADVDLMTVDRRVLAREFWEAFDAEPDVRPGDFEDPLAGVVRLKGQEERSLDLIVAKYRFAAEVIDRARPGIVGGMTLPVVTLPDLVLLKLFAGGPQDAWDIEQALLTGGDSLIATVEEQLGSVPGDARDLWQRIRRRR